ITQLSSAEALLDVPDETETDPLHALPGTFLAGRFRLRRRHGSGSTAVRLHAAGEPQKHAPEQALLRAMTDDAARPLYRSPARVPRRARHRRLRPPRHQTREPRSAGEPLQPPRSPRALRLLPGEGRGVRDRIGHGPLPRPVPG